MNSTKALRAATYRRVSSEGQKDNTSLPEQRRKTREEVERRGWTLVTEYADEGLSGTDANRPGWRQMLADAEAGKFDVLVVLNTKRFARKSWHAIKEMENLLELGVSLVSLQESFDLSTPAGRAMFGMSAVFANLDRDSIIENTVAGQRALARENRLPGGEPPYGYRREGQRRTSVVVPDEAEREVLRLGYDLLVKRRLSAYQVADQLNDAGVRPRKAERWSAEVVRGIWRNATNATGKVIWGAPKASEAGGQRRHKAKVDRQGNPVHGGAVEVDLGNPTFTVAQHRSVVRALERRITGTAAKPAVSRLLTGRVFSTEGHAMYAVNLPREAWEGAYRCSKRRASAGDDRCTCSQLRAKPIEDTVWAAVAELLGDPARLEQAARLYLALPDDNSDSEADARALAGVEAEVGKLERALTRAERGVLMADTADDERRQQAMVSELKGELTAARERFTGYLALVSSAEARGQALQDVAALAERARGRLQTMGAAERAEVVRILRVSVVVGGEVTAGEAQTLVISGVVDPRLWVPSSGSGSKGSGTTPADRDAQSAPGVAPWPPSPSPVSWS
ncbi:recombinase family protein [Microbacterium enclense]|uniref:recombinase family protein n=1 Tax=Microbacterium enclense TaxID=993073 RepID=UPI00203D3364|nr:recombinase family protein [Microbacterium enclense]MCM3614608.1 recombinase family protein [Microbacterium enclense]